MRKPQTQSMRAFLIGMALAAYAATPALADDTEIYLQSGASNPNNIPLVMFTLDFRSNLTNTFGGCSNVGSGSAPTYAGICEPARYFALKGLAAELPAANKPFTMFDALRLALKVVLDNVTGVKVGLMISHAHEQGGEGPSHGADANGNARKSNGGVILMGLQQLVAGDANNARANFQEKLKGLKAWKTAATCGAPTDDACLDHTYQGKELFFELYRYLTGKKVYNGHNGWADFEKSGNSNTNMACSYADSPRNKACWDPTIETGSGNDFTYISPLIGAGECTSINTINLFFGNSQQQNDSNTEIAKSVVLGGTGAPKSTDQDMIRFLHTADLGSPDFGTGNIAGNQNVKSYFLYDGQQSGTVNSFAQAGGTDIGLLIGDDPEALVEKLTGILNQILSVSTTFVAASVPVNVFNRAEVIDNVYIALFQAQKQPLWPGNLKKVKIQQTTDNQGAVVTRLVDAQNPPIDAVATDGRVKHEALTYWTNGGSLPPPAPSSAEIAGRDGRSVQRGGAGQKIPGFLSGGVGVDNTGTNRQVLTEPASYTNGSATPLMEIAANNAGFNALKTHFSAQGAAETPAAYETRITNYLKWLRGQDVTDIDADTNLTEPRFMKLLKQDGSDNGVIQWLLADTLHSRPVAINYGARATDGHTAANPDIRILMGTNDGAMHLFRNTGSGATELGSESWAFVPREMLKLSETLIDSLAAGTHPYGVDGAPSVYFEDHDGDGTIELPDQNGKFDKVIAVFGLRRGGQSMYALDISNPNTPSIRWKIANTGSFSDLGHTFSTPRVGTVKFGATPTPAVIFAGGYDLDKDARPGPGTNDNVGIALYVVNALDGSVIKKFTDPALVDSMPSDVTAIDTTGSGHFDRLYIGTTGGQIWRADLPPNPADIRDNWQLNKVADLGRHANGGLVNDRRFFHRVDVVQAIDSIGTFDAVIATSGDRENPRSINAPGMGTPIGTNDYMFLVKDRNTSSTTLPLSGYPITHDQLGDVTNNCLQSNTCAIAPDLTKGFRLELEVEGEKGLATPTTINNTIFFTTYIPNSGSNASDPCLPNEGGGRLYAISLKDGSSVFNFNLADDGDPLATPDGLTKRDRFVDLRSGGIPAEVVILPPDKLLLPDLSIIKTGGSGNFPTFWYQIEDVNRPN